MDECRVEPVEVATQVHGERERRIVSRLGADRDAPVTARHWKDEGGSFQRASLPLGSALPAALASHDHDRNRLWVLNGFEVIRIWSCRVERAGGAGGECALLD